MAVTRNTIRASSWDTVYTYLQTTNPISTNNIYSALNSKLVNTVGYPFVIIKSPKISFEKVTIEGRITDSTVSILIEIYHTSSEQVKILADDVTAKCLAGRETFSAAGLKNMNIEGDDDDDEPNDGDKKIHRSSFDLSFRYVGKS